MQGKQAFTIAMVVTALAFTTADCGRDASESTAPATSVTAVGTAAGSTAAGTSTPTARVRAASPSPSAAPQKFSATIGKIPSRETLKYSWRPGCPVPISGLRLLKMTYWGFDNRPHTGEMVVNADAAPSIVKVFRKLYDMRFPIRRMQLVDVYKGSDFESIEAGNTSAFNCRNATGSGSWSQHAYGLAVDVNTCENPYVTAAGEVAHKHCVKFRDRSRRDRGMIHAGDKVVRAFESIGWGWGGDWSGARDYQHFSSNGR
jgi:D-alanyl-D-alanine carboxypeptidase-like protein